MSRTPTPAFLALVAGLLGAAPILGEVRSAQVVQEDTDFARGRFDPGISLRGGSVRALRDASFESSVLDAGLTFSAIGPHWQGAAHAALELSVSPDGVRWGGWIAVPREGEIGETCEDGTPNPFSGDSLGALVFVAPNTRFVRYRVQLPETPSGEAGLGRVAFHVIDPGTGPELPIAGRHGMEPGETALVRPAVAGRAGRRASAPPPEIPNPVPGAGKPPISLRATWGARPPKTGYTYTLAAHLAFHHTATVEDWSATTWDECAARVRAIQTYHMDTNGWNDLGYAYVICKHGDVFQAREDDDDATDVQGAHDGFNRESAGISLLGYFHPPVDHQPTAAQVSSLVDLMAWIAGRRGIDPLGRNLYEAFGAPADNLYGHREVKATDCPGDHLFALKELIRTSVSNRLLRMPL